MAHDILTPASETAQSSGEVPSVGELDLCFTCGGRVQRVDGPGRVYRYRGQDYVLPADLALATCEACGDRWLTPDDASAITRAIEAQRPAPVPSLVVRAAG